jgi:UDP-N-acetylglucosamine transferase subunit ALG13
MIFLTVGSELPFNRLVQAVDQWCDINKDIDVFGQIGDPGPSGYLPRYFKWREFIPPDEYRRRYDEAELIISHAGMGSIITALVKAKPILVLPRRAILRETRNDHQIATVQYFAQRNGVLVAKDESMVVSLMDEWEMLRMSIKMECAGSYAEDRLIQTIKNFIQKR